eukprot:TRINITY_DN1030_c0_g1_i1.p1 TRINITY_DN1030_c0_g1~~TRINITY_DN1030_c0_g1_i1.p1  ORF type:complete len:1469 (+),score=552.86 TRINITY_DN1030_c0_g1_i1:103-4407(+)
MLEPTIVQDYRRAEDYDETARDLPSLVPFRGVVFEADAQHDPSPMDLLRQLSQQAQRSCKMVLYKTDLSSDLASLYSVVFDVVLDSAKEKAMGVRPKPSPEGILQCLADLDILPQQSVAFVTSVPGAVACHEANFGLVVCSGADSLQNEDAYRAAGVDVVLPADRPLSLARLNWMFKARVMDSGWQLRYHVYNPRAEKLRETLTAVGNGYCGVRGSPEWAKSSKECYPGCYIAGVYNCSASTVRGIEIRNSDLVNCPNWTAVQMRIGDSGEWVNPLEQDVLEYSHGVDLAVAQHERSITFQDREGRRTRIRSTRVASMASPHLCAQVYTVTPLNYSHPVTVRSAIDGDVRNEGVERYLALNRKHLRVSRAGDVSGRLMYLTAETTGLRDRVEICTVARHSALADGRAAPAAERRFERSSTEVAEVFVFPGKQGVSYAVEKLVSIWTSRDPPSGQSAGQSLLDRACAVANGPRSFEDACVPHRAKWRGLWDGMDIRLQGDRRTWLMQKMARMHLYHILSSCSPNNLGMDAGLTARGLTGENHRGHVFWDEAFITPTLVSTHPEVAKAHLQYRTNRIDAARAHAKEHGYTGAMVPWQTSDTGAEDTQVVKFNPVSGKWDPDMSRRQRHVGIAVFLDAWRYIEATADLAFLAGDLGVLMLEIARFFAGLAKLDPADNRYHISGVMGPDEYHEEVGCLGGGVVDNAYTNVMTVWLLSRALDIARGQVLPQSERDALARRVHLSEEETAHWVKVTQTMAVHIQPDGLIEEFKGWNDLQDLDWKGYAQKYDNLQRLDRILKAEGKTPDSFKVVKQPDTLMLFYFLTLDEVGGILRQLGYPCDPLQVLRRNFDYYVPLTTAGSALAFTVHARLAKLLGRNEAQKEWMMESVTGDVFGQRSADGAPSEGLHLGVMAGTIELLVANTLGLREVGDRVYEIHPELLPGCHTCTFSRLLHGVWFHFVVTRRDVTISRLGAADWCAAGDAPMRFSVGAHSAHVEPGRPVVLRYRITGLKEFIGVMKRTRVIRADVLRRVFTQRPMQRQQLLALRSARDLILSLPAPEEGAPTPYTRVLEVDGVPCYTADLSHEVGDIDRDLCYLQEGEQAFTDQFPGRVHGGFAQAVGGAADWLGRALGSAKRFGNWLSSRDGTIVPRQERFLTSIQPAYNSVFLTRFATTCCQRALIITKSPLGGEASERGEPVEANGLWDVSVNPPDIFAYAGSMGRSFLTTQEVRGNLPIDPQSDRLLQALARRVSALLQRPQFEKFRAFGHGLQTRWGLFVVPKGDSCIRLSRPEQQRLKEAVSAVAKEVDPSGRFLNVEDTGDELHVSIRPRGTRVGEWDKGAGVRFLHEKQVLQLQQGPNLVCVDHERDLPMVDTCLEFSKDTWCVFVSPDAAAAQRVRARYPQVLVLPTPDHLICALNAVALKAGATQRVIPPGPAGRL